MDVMIMFSARNENGEWNVVLNKVTVRLHDLQRDYTIYPSQLSLKNMKWGLSCDVVGMTSPQWLLRIFGLNLSFHW